MTITSPTRELIESGRIAESAHYDFKQEVDLDKKYPNGGKSAKERFIDDVVAFLNTESGGHLVIGVKEADGVWESYIPLTSDREKTCNRFLQVIQSSIDPIPTAVEVLPIDVPGGYVLDVNVGAHWKKPYQSRISGSFYIRSGARNRVLSVPEIMEMSAAIEKMEADLTRLYREHERELVSLELNPVDLYSSIVIGERRPETASMSVPRLTFGVLPRQYYNRSQVRYNPAKMSHTGIAAFHGSHYPKLKGGPGGFEAKLLHERLFVGTDWHILGHVNEPFDSDHGRPNVSLLRQKLTRYLSSVSRFLKDEGILGPYAVMLGIDNLDQLEGWSDRGLPTGVGDARPTVVGELYDDAMISNLIEQVRSAVFD
ncbi:ATP-binding protein [Neorhizobium sp. BT27B]|uniref:AlbA family DNA-binding domain-containing protein n=1 Tax=Neorhizobium sp. BT27B TaxID=3142625 RepID=UPI003D2BF4F9